MSGLLLTAAETATKLGLTEHQVRREHDRGLLPGRRVGRFLRFTDEDIATYLDRIRDDRAGDRSGQTPRSAAYHRRQRQQGRS